MHFLDVERSCKISGGTVYLLLLAQGLIERGHQFTLAARDGALSESFTQVGARRLKAGIWPLSIFPVLAYAARHPADLYLCSGRGRARHTALLAARWQHKPCVCMLHDPLRPEHTLERLLQPTMLVTLERPIYEAALALGVPPERIRLWPRPVRTRPLGPPPDEGFQVVCVGRLSESKLSAVETLIAAVTQLAPQLPGLRLTLVGGGGKAAIVEHLAAEANRGLHREVIRLVGTVLDPLAWIEQANLVVAGGYSCLEALYGGRPAIASGYGWFGPVTAADAPRAVAQHFGDRCEGRHSIEALTEAILTVHASLRAEPERSPYLPSRMWFAEDHSMEHTAQLMEDLGRECLQLQTRERRGS